MILYLQMEGVQLVTDLLKEGVSIDLKDAYLSVPITGKHRKLLRFQWQGQLFPLCPQQCTAHPHQTLEAGDGSIKAERSEVSDCHRQPHSNGTVTSKDDQNGRGGDMSAPGTGIHHQLGEIVPDPLCVFLGFLVNSVNMRLYLPEEKKQQIIADCREALQQGTISVQGLARLVGHMTVASQVVPPASLRYIALQRAKNKAFRRTQSIEIVVRLGSRVQA